MNQCNLDKTLMSDLTWVEFAQRVRDNYIFILPAGSLEQHGPHLPLSMDTIAAYEISMELALHYPVVVMPPLYYGYRSQATVGGGDLFPGTTSIGAEALIFTIRDILLELLRHGVRRIVVTNGHLENSYFLTEGVELARRSHPLNDAKILLTSWDQFVRPATLEAIFRGNFPGWNYEHAAINETSIMMVLRPNAVDLLKIPNEPPPRIINYSVFPTPGNVVTQNGSLSPALGASFEIGQQILADVWEGFKEAFENEFGIQRVEIAREQPR
jgi:creatinine amidohydrolase